MCTCPRRSIIVWSPRQVYCKSRTWRHRSLHTQDAAHAIPVACHSTPKHLLGLVPAACTPLRVPTRYPAPFTHTRDARERAMRSARLLSSRPPSYNPSDAARASYIFFIVASVCVAAVTSHVRLFSSERLDAPPPTRGADFSSSDPSWTASTCFGPANFCQDAL